MVLLKISSFLVIANCLFSACASNTFKTISLQIENAADQKFYLEEVPVEGGNSVVLDSFLAKERISSFTSSISAASEDRLLRIRSADRRIRLWFIDEDGNIQLKINYLEPEQFDIVGSPSSTSLNNFSKWYQRFVQENRKGVDFDIAAPDQIDKVLFREQLEVRNFIDTTSSVVCALFFYSAVDFGKDYSGLDKFIERLHNRFPTDSRLGELYNDTKNYVRIFTEELKVGDQIPDFYIQSATGAYLPLSYYRQGYQLIDCWASFDGLSVKRRGDLQRAFNRFGSRMNFIMISLDPVKNEWRRYLELAPQPGLQFNDDASWKGMAATQLKFDSIPFNFLIDPHGKILGKALYGDALLQKLDSVFGVTNQ